MSRFIFQCLVLSIRSAITHVQGRERSRRTFAEIHNSKTWWTENDTVERVGRKLPTRGVFTVAFSTWKPSDRVTSAKRVSVLVHERQRHGEGERLRSKKRRCTRKYWNYSENCATKSTIRLWIKSGLENESPITSVNYTCLRKFISWRKLTVKR